MRFNKTAVLSALLSLAIFLVAGLFGIYELKGKLFINGLVARNEGERTINLLMVATREVRRRDESRPMPMRGRGEMDPIRETTEMIEALPSHSLLSSRIVGLAAYDSAGKVLARYGTAPEQFDEKTLTTGLEGNPPRSYTFDQAAQTMRIASPFPVFKEGRGRGESMICSFYEIREERYFRENLVARVYFCLWILLAAVLILVIRRTVLKNIAYRTELQSQKELVALGSAARTLAHEIKNPLSAISLQTSLVARIAPSVAEKELAVIDEEVARIRLLVDRIGDFLREPEGHPEEVDLLAFARALLERAGRDGSPVPLLVEEEGLHAMVDPSRLRSILENIVRNAFDSGGDSGEVSVRIRGNGVWAVLEVLDRGKGLPPPSEVERLFDPFYTTKIKGFGLGLALSRRFAEAVGGKLELLPREGGGAIARLSLKRKPA